MKAFIFDLDGVLCHTDKFHFAAWAALAKKLDLPFDASVNDRLRGVSRMESLDIVLGEKKDAFTAEQKKSFADEKNAIYRGYLQTMTVSGSSLSVLISFLMVLPVLYGAVRTGIGSVDVQLLEMAKVFRLPLGRRLRAIWLPAVLPAFRQGCSVALGICWKSGVAAEVIGLPDGSIGDALYRAKITLSTGELFAWTFVIILLSAVFEKLFLALLDRAVARVLGEEGV